MWGADRAIASCSWPDHCSWPDQCGLLLFHDPGVRLEVQLDAASGIHICYSSWQPARVSAGEVLHQVALLVSACGLFVWTFDGLRLRSFSHGCSALYRPLYGFYHGWPGTGISWQCCMWTLLQLHFVHHGLDNSLDLRAPQDLIAPRSLLGIPIEHIADQLPDITRVVSRHRGYTSANNVVHELGNATSFERCLQGTHLVQDATHGPDV